jgi:hypothetical protein
MNERADLPDLDQLDPQSLKALIRAQHAELLSQLEADLVNAWKHDPVIALQKEVHAGYTASAPSLTDSFYSGNFGGAGGNRTHA